MSNSISPRTNKIVNVVISLGAAVVLVGALAKIIHLSWADYALIVGLLTEALIFVIYAFLPPPEMGGGSSDGASGTTDAVLAKLESAKIDQAAFDKLSTSFQRLNDTAMYLGDIADMAKSSKEFAQNTSTAATSMGGVNDAILGVSNNLAGFATATSGVKDLSNQFEMMGKSMEEMNQYYSKLTEASAAMSSSAGDAVRAKEQIGILADNLTKLNQIYGNMIVAMQGRA
jgi:methyl-accepting chemotaxis protein